MATFWNILSVLGAWTLACGCWWLIVAPRLVRRHGQGPGIAVVWHLNRLLMRVRHRVRYEGLEHVAMSPADGPQIVVANHTGGVDPLLIQAAVPGIIHWMMARDMMGTGQDRVWRFLKIIPVDRTGPDPAALRAALRVLRGGGLLGVFPEGFITRPPGTIRPFQEGIGLLAARTGVPVQPCWISETPDVEGVSASVLGPSHARVVFLPRVTFERGMDPGEVAADLRGRIARAADWPMHDEPMPLVLDSA